MVLTRCQSVIVGIPERLTQGAWQHLNSAFRPSTSSAHRTHFRTFILYTLHFELNMDISLPTVLSFMQYLYMNGISPKVIGNYISSIRTMCAWYDIDHGALSHHKVFLLLRSFKINNLSQPTVRGIFDIPTLQKISESCCNSYDPPLFRSIFLVAFYGFFRMSNIAPHSASAFDPSRHFLRQDVIFSPPGVHIRVKWSKTQQNRQEVKWTQLPKVQNQILCPVTALHSLLTSRPLSPRAPLFFCKAANQSIHDTKIRDILRTILQTLGITHQGHGFHAFRRSGASWAFDNNIPIEQIMAHGSWRSGAIWEYLQQTSSAGTNIAHAFSKCIPP